MNILSIIFVSIASFANATNFGGAMHGRKMAVSYKSTSVGEHILVVKERVGIENKKAKFRQSQVVSLNLKRGNLCRVTTVFNAEPTMMDLYMVLF